jgi:hypothetical protein
MRWTLLALCLFCFDRLPAQSKRFTRLFQASLTPGINTNGLHPGGFSNYFSLNLTSGYSARTYLLEIGIISNLNVEETRGLQFAGIANVTGGNMFAGMQLREIDKKKREGAEANLSGAQFSGLANIVLNNVFGAQITGGVNVAKGALQGFQVAGISNTVGKYAFGLQLAGLYNIAAESMDGAQVSSLFNITQGGLFGVQFGMFNKAGFIEGINSFMNDRPSGLQIGLLNHSKTMNGFQIGLVNISRSMQGTQVGIVNIYNNGKSPQTRDGTSIGLVNIGSSGYVSMYASDLFLANFEVATGTFKNHRINADAREKQIQNALIYAVSPAFLGEKQTWALGYGLKKYYFNRSTAPGYNKMYYFSAGVDFLHLNHERGKLTKELSLLSRPHVSAGSRFHPKNKRYYFFAAIAYNIYQSARGKSFDTFLGEASGKPEKLQHAPGFAVGILVQ